MKRFVASSLLAVLFVAVPAIERAQEKQPQFKLTEFSDGIA